MKRIPYAVLAILLIYSQCWGFMLISSGVVASGSSQTNVYVDPDATGTANGTSWANAYTSLFDAEAGEQSVLTQPMVIHCRSSSGTADSTQVTIDGWTTTSDNYLKIVVDQADRHDGKWNDTKYRLEITGDPYLDFLIINEPFVWIDGLQFRYDTDRASDYSVIYSGGVSGWIYISSTVVRGVNAQGNISGIEFGTADINDDRYIWNNIITVDGVAVESVTQHAADFYIYSNTLVSQSDVALNRIYNSTGTVVLKNNYAHSETGEAYTSSDTWNTKLTCASSDTTGSTGLQNVAYATGSGAYFTNVIVGSEDLHIGNVLSSLIGAATDTTGESSPLNFTTDIDGDTRSGWDIGADED